MRISIKDSRLYLALVALIVVSVVGGCAKKSLPLNPPRVQAASGDFTAADEVAPPQAGAGSGAASAAKSEARKAKEAAEKEAAESATSAASGAGITEETLAESESSFPSGSFRPGENYLSGAILGSGGTGEAGSAGGAGGPTSGSGSLSGGLGGLAPGAGGKSDLGSGGFNEFSGSGPTVGEGSRAGGLGKFAPGAGQAGNLDVARMIPFVETADLTDVHFKFDRFDLDPHSKNILAKNAQWLKSHPDVKVEIQGHCDERGTNNYNLGLGERRALSTKKYLMALGISQDRLFTISYGEERPFCTEHNENCWWQNRRGHFLVSK